MITAIQPTPPAAAPLSDSGPTQRRAFLSEWRKLRTLRSTAVGLIAAVASFAGTGMAIAAVSRGNWSKMSGVSVGHAVAIDRSLGGIYFAQLAIGVLGVLFVTAEYGTGMIKSTFTAIPARVLVLWAKTGVFGLVTLVLMVPTALVAFLGGQTILGPFGVSLGASGALQAVVGAGLYLTVEATLATGLGFIARSTAGGIAALFGLMLVLPAVGEALPSNVQDALLPYLPSRAGSAIYNLHPLSHSLGPWTGLGVMCLWAIAGLTAAVVLVRRRDL